MKKYLYNLESKRTYRENGVRYVGPCQVQSEYSDLEKRFVGVLVLVGEVKVKVEKAEEPDAAGEVEAPVPVFKRANKSNAEKPVISPEDVMPKLVPVHKGKGRWQVVEEASQRPINDKFLTKKEAYDICGL